jgi:hypothetical protein
MADVRFALDMNSNGRPPSAHHVNEPTRYGVTFGGVVKAAWKRRGSK